MPGGIDTDAIRRSWPDVLTKIATISRVTWSFVSQNTRVLDYNGERLLLGLTTDGLLTALRGRNHAEVVRQALIEVIGVDTKVEGVLSTDAAPTDSASADPVSADAAPRDAVATDDEPDDDWNVSARSEKSASAPPPPHAERIRHTCANANPGPALNTEAASEGSRSPRGNQTEDERLVIGRRRQRGQRG